MARALRKAITYSVHPSPLRYGENPSNVPADLLVRLPESKDSLAFTQFKRVEGKEPGFVNIIDVDRAVETIARIAAGFEKNFGKRQHRDIAVILKHGNTCGAAVEYSAPQAALAKAIDGDTDAAFGGVVIANFPIDLKEAMTLREHRTVRGEKRIFDIVIAPHFTVEAVMALRRPRGGCIMLENRALFSLGLDSPYSGERVRQVRGGFVREKVNTFIPFITETVDELLRIRGDASRIMTHRANLVLAWAVGSSSTSNSITVTYDSMVLVNACGRQSRVGACQLASDELIRRVQKPGSGLAAYSDGFFPFEDGPRQLQRIGVDIVLYPRGSMKDDEIGQAMQERMTLVTLPEYARGFYGH